MARQPKANDYYFDVKDIGRFRAARRTMAIEVEIQREYASMAGGVEPTAWLITLAEYLSTLRVLVVDAPEGWDMENMDPLDDETYQQLGQVFSALREREETFRRKPGAPGKESGQANGEHGGSVVSPDVPLTPEQPAVHGDNV